jgi:DNA-binding NarL/FixJ family response regulator
MVHRVRLQEYPSLLTLIVAKSGAMQEALNTVLSSIPEINIVGIAHDYVTAQEMMARQSPELVVIDSNLPPNQDTGVIRQLKLKHPHLRLIVLVDGIQQQQELIELGADAALLRGVPIEQITEAINTILTSKGMG